jgi:myosin V
MLRNLYRKRYLQIRNGIILCQARIRGMLARKRAEVLRRERAATLIQANWRGYAARSKYSATRNQVIRLQSFARGFLVRRNYRSVREERAAVTIQRIWRGSKDRRRYLRVRSQVILAQGCVRRHAARKELKTLREEAKSVSHLKEVSYKLEFKVVELTQSLTKRNQEYKALVSQVSVLESQLASWQERHSTLEERAAGLEMEAGKANDAIARTFSLEQELKTLQGRYDDTQKNLDNMEKEAASLKDTLTKRSAELEHALSERESSEQVRGSLNQEIQSLRLEVERLSEHGPSLSPVLNGQKTPATANGKTNGLLAVSSGKSNRTPRRRSYVDTGDSSGDELKVGSVAFNPRPVSMAFSTVTFQKNWMGSPTTGEIPSLSPENIDSEVLSD